VVLGGPEENVFARWLAANSPSPLVFHPHGSFEVNGRLFYESGTGLIALQSHPTRHKGLACILVGTDDEGLELAARLFPLRTGVPVPEWVVIGEDSRWKGAGGFLGAGYWSHHWKWSESMSYLA